MLFRSREFDVVTLDRVKRIEVKEDFAVWKEYARSKGLHGAVVSYLDIKKENFYRVETTAEGLQFATARGWEDLSELLCAYEKLGLKADGEVIVQYIQSPRIARDFANYLALYEKYQRDYHVDAVLRGEWQAVTVSELRAAAFDEKLSVMGLLLSRLTEAARNVRRQDALADALHAALTDLRDNLREEPNILPILIQERRTALKRAREANQMDRESQNLAQRTISALEDYRRMLIQEGITGPDEIMDAVRGWFGGEVDRRALLAELTGRQLENAFRFLEDAFGQGQELVLFVTELTACPDTSWFVETFGCDAYFRHNSELLFDDTRQRLQEEIAAARAADLKEVSHE